MAGKWLISIQGPTASGKTSLAIFLAEKLHTEIISADSRQFYREMKIGTARPTDEELKIVRHHFISEFSIFNPVNASGFETMAIKVIDEILSKKNVTIITGGSGLYLDAVLNGFNPIPDVEKQVREELLKEYQDSGLEKMAGKLKNLDPEYCRSADLKNPRRVLRALEICISSGKPYSFFLKLKKPERNFKALKIGIQLPLEILHKNINDRCDEMIRNGLTEEALELFPYRHLVPLQSIGYIEFFDYFEGKYSLDFAIEKFKQHTRNYAKKQITWLKKDKNIQWFNPNEKEQILQLILSGE